MAVLWRGMENQAANASFQAAAAPTGNLKDKNTFFEKHVRICNPMLTEADMKKEVKKSYDSRNSSPATVVESSRGPRRKDDTFGKLKPPATGILFATTKAFMEITAWIEDHVSTDDAHCHVPILGGAVVVSYDSRTSAYEVIHSGSMVLGIRVGPAVTVVVETTPFSDPNDAMFDREPIPNTASKIRSKLAYHMNPSVRSPVPASV